MFQYPSGNRVLQTTFGNLVGAPRFEIIQGCGAGPTECPKCQQRKMSQAETVSCDEMGNGWNKRGAKVIEFTTLCK